MEGVVVAKMPKLEYLASPLLCLSRIDILISISRYSFLINKFRRNMWYYPESLQDL